MWPLVGSTRRLSASSPYEIDFIRTTRLSSLTQWRRRRSKVSHGLTTSYARLFRKIRRSSPDKRPRRSCAIAITYVTGGDDLRENLKQALHLRPTPRYNCPSPDLAENRSRLQLSSRQSAPL